MLRHFGIHREEASSECDSSNALHYLQLDSHVMRLIEGDFKHSTLCNHFALLTLAKIEKSAANGKSNLLGGIR